MKQKKSNKIWVEKEWKGSWLPENWPPDDLMRNIAEALGKATLRGPEKGGPSADFKIKNISDLTIAKDILKQMNFKKDKSPQKTAWIQGDLSITAEYSAEQKKLTFYFWD